MPDSETKERLKGRIVEAYDMGKRIMVKLKEYKAAKALPALPKKEKNENYKESLSKRRRV
jgi:hypothetical protein